MCVAHEGYYWIDDDCFLRMRMDCECVCGREGRIFGLSERVSPATVDDGVAVVSCSRVNHLFIETNKLQSSFLPSFLFN